MTTTAQAPTTPAGVVAAARGVLADLDPVIWAAKPAEVLLEVTVELERLRSAVAAVQAQVAIEIDASGAAKTAGWASAADCLTAVAGGRHGAGSRLLRTAAALTADRQATWLALHAGEVSPEQAQVVVAAVDRLPVDAGVRERAERFLLDRARVLNASELARAAEHLIEVADPDGAAKREEKKLDKLERSAHLNRFLAIVEDGLGGVRVKGRGSVEDAAVIKAALAALSAPQPSTDPECGLDGKDPRDHGARTWDALVEACQRLADAEVLPGDHGMRPRVIVTVDYAALRAGLGAGALTTGERLSVSAVRRLGCDADILPVALGSAGQVLDLGRSQRLVTTLLWLALIARDRHCAFPGCRRPPVACDAHHIRHWADGGPTCLDNLVMLCRAHHTMIHSTPWQARLSPTDRLPEFRPPPDRRLTPDLHHQIDQRDEWIRERRPRE